MLAQSFNKMAEALQPAETRRQQLLADVRYEPRTPITELPNNIRAIPDEVVEMDKEQMITLFCQSRHLRRLVDHLDELAQADIL